MGTVLQTSYTYQANKTLWTGLDASCIKYFPYSYSKVYQFEGVSTFMAQCRFESPTYPCYLLSISGHLGGDAKKLAIPMFEAMRDFALEDQPIVLRTIKLVIYKAELFDIYKEAMQETLSRYCVE